MSSASTAISTVCTDLGASAPTSGSVRSPASATAAEIRRASSTSSAVSAARSAD